MGEGLANAVKSYGNGSLVDGLRRAARMILYLEQMVKTDPGIPLRGALQAAESQLANLGVGD